MDIQGIKKWTRKANWLLRESTEGHNKQIAAALSEIKGRTVSAHYVWQQGNEDRNYNNYLQSFFEWIAAKFYGNTPGFELTWLNTQLFVSELQRKKTRRLSSGDLTLNPPFPADAARAIYEIENRLEQLKGCFGMEVRV